MGINVHTTPPQHLAAQPPGPAALPAPHFMPPQMAQQPLPVPGMPPQQPMQQPMPPQPMTMPAMPPPPAQQPLPWMPPSTHLGQSQAPPQAAFGALGMMLSPEQTAMAMLSVQQHQQMQQAQQPPPDSDEKRPCFFWARNRCSKGDECEFSHIGNPGAALRVAGGCFNCGQQGHKAAECPKGQASGPRGGGRHHR